MTLYVDSKGKVRERAPEDGFDPIAQNGHRLSGEASTAAARFELPHLELPRIELPTAAYVALGALGVAVVGAPIVGLYIVSRVGKAAVKAAPAVAEIGSAVVPLVPKAAPLVAAASLYTQAKSGGVSSQPAEKVASDVATVLRALGLAPAESPPVPSSSSTPTLPRELVARGTQHVASASAQGQPAHSSTASSPGSTLVSPR
jgi:hypothetical protein